MSYSVREVASMLGLSAAQVRSYATKGFLQPERGPHGELRFGFHDLVILRTAGELAAAKVPQRKVQRVLERLREQLPRGRSLTGIRISADGDRVVVFTDRVDDGYTHRREAARGDRLAIPGLSGVNMTAGDFLA